MTQLTTQTTVATRKKSGKDSGLPAQIDTSKPLSGQVHKLGDYYWEWVHTPEVGAPRIFESDLLEFFSIGVWWLVPTIFVPLLVLAVVAAHMTGRSSNADIASGALFGVVMWQTFEYMCHRFLFHRKPTFSWGITVHFTIHGAHHKYPMDKRRDVFPPVPALIIGTFFWILFNCLIPANFAWPVWAGFGVGYVLYDLIHYALHTDLYLPGTFLNILRTRHNAHHYKDAHHSFGVTSEMFDLLFGT